MYRFSSPDLHWDLRKYIHYTVIQPASLRFNTLSDHVSLKLLTTYLHILRATQFVIPTECVYLGAEILWSV
jgi:hypothetical protein